MNCINLIGRLTADPIIVFSGETKIARYTLAVDRSNKDTDFITCVCFKNGADFAERFLHKGVKVGVTGSLQTGSYEKNGVKHYTSDVIVNTHTFCENKGTAKDVPADANDFMEIPDNIANELPFN